MRGSARSWSWGSKAEAGRAPHASAAALTCCVREFAELQHVQIPSTSRARLSGLDRLATMAHYSTMTDPTFTPDQFRQAQHKLGLSDRDFAAMLGLSSADQVRRLKVADVNAASHRPVRPYIARLVKAYLDGYRPEDWPEA